MKSTVQRSGAPPVNTLTASLMLTAAALCVGTVGLSSKLNGRLGLPLDDGWIHLQFARNLAAGHGLAYEPGAWVAGSTAPLWTALLALVSALPGPPVLWAQGLGAICFVASVPIALGLGRALGLRRPLLLLAGASMVLTGPLVWAAVSGLEISLFVLLSLLATRVHLRERSAVSGLPLSLVLLALAALVRPEGLLLLALAVGERLLAAGGSDSRAEHWRSTIAGIALAALVLAPVVLFNLTAGGSPLPTTFSAKGAGLHRLVPDLRYLHTVIGIFFRSQPYMTWLAAAGVVSLVAAVRAGDRRGLLPALWVVGLPVAYSFLAAPGNALVGNFGRYYYPLFPFVILLGCLGVQAMTLAGASGDRDRRPGRLLAVVLGLLILWPTAAHLITTAGRFSQSVGNIELGDGAAARWLQGRLPPDAVIAVNDVGLLKYLLPDREVLDLAGIVTPELRGYTDRAIAAGRPRGEGVRAFLEARQPDFLVVFPQWFPGLVGQGSRYRPVREFAVPNNITLGGDRVVIFETPWTRQSLAP